MARGWESKAVEAQIEALDRDRKPEGVRLTIEQLEQLRHRETLTLSRKKPFLIRPPITGVSTTLPEACR